MLSVLSVTVTSLHAALIVGCTACWQWWGSSADSRKRLGHRISLVVCVFDSFEMPH
jgi:hypothetical protein